MSNVISLEAYRFSLRVRGTTLLWQSISVTLTRDEADSLSQGLYAVNTIGKHYETSAAGFRLIAKDREITVVGRGLGPAKARRGAEVTAIGQALLAAARKASKC